MGKYDIIHNKRTNHPSIDVGEEPANGKGDKAKWLNYEMTHSPTSGDSYREIDNPDKKDKRHPKSYIRKYLRKDRTYHKGRKYAFSLSDEQKAVVDAMLLERETNIAALSRNGKRKSGPDGSRCLPASSCEPGKGHARLSQRHEDGIAGQGMIRPKRESGQAKKKKARKGKARR